MYASFNSISLSALSEEVRAFSLKSYAYSCAFSKAFSFAITPRLLTISKSFLQYSLIGLNTLERQELTSVQLQYNPVRAALKAAWSELSSEEAIACYLQVHRIANARLAEAKEQLIDVAIIGLCGVVLVSMGIDIAKDAYSKAVALYQKVHGYFSPAASGPTILPTVDMAIASKSDAEIEAIAHQLQQERQTIVQFDIAETTALAEVRDRVGEVIVQVKVEELKKARAELVLARECDRASQAQLDFVIDKAIEFTQEERYSQNVVGKYVPVIADEIWNPEPENIHRSVEGMAQEQASLEAIASALDIPGAAAERKSRKRTSSSASRKRRTAKTT